MPLNPSFRSKAAHIVIFCCCMVFSLERLGAVIHTPPVESTSLPFIEQISIDFDPFKNTGFAASAVSDTMSAIPEGHMCAIYRIDDRGACILSTKNQRTVDHPVTSIMLRGFQEFVVFCTKNSMRIPKVEFAVYLDDWTTSDTPFPAPLFVFAKDHTQGQGLVLLPDFEMLAGYETIAQQTQKACKHYPWKCKKEKVIWRGTTTGSPHNGQYTPTNFRDFPRTQLVEISLANPTVVDARFTKLCQGAELFPTLLAPYCGNFMSIPDHIRYKYQILVDGNTCAFSRCYWQLLSNCLMLKQESPHIQWYYRGLQPYVHYVPVHGDLSNLLKQVAWACSHDKKARRISKNATAFAKKHLTKEVTFTYMHRLFTEYEKLVKG